MSPAVGDSEPSPAAEEDTGSTFGGKQDDTSFTVVATDYLSVRIGDTTTTISPTTQQNIAETYEANGINCAFQREHFDEAVNEEIDEICDPEDGPTDAEIAAAATSEFQTLNLDAPPITHQPSTDWALVNMDFIVYTDAAVQTLDATILGVPVTIRATPVHYRWDFGDGSDPLATTDQGAPYPNHTVSHLYTDVAEAVSVTLTTTWQGEFRVGTGAWVPIAGMATTTSRTDPVEIVAVEVNLVPNE